MAMTSAPKCPIQQFLDKLPPPILQEIVGNDYDSMRRRQNLVAKGGEALRILKTKTLPPKMGKPITRAGIIVDFLCRQGYNNISESFRQTSLPVDVLSKALSLKGKKNVGEMQALVSSLLEASFPRKSSSQQGIKRKQSGSSTDADGSSRPSLSKAKVHHARTNLIQDLCIRLGPLIPNAGLAASYAQKILTNFSNNSNSRIHSKEHHMLMNDLSRNVEYYEAACLFLAVQKLEGSDYRSSKRPNKQVSNEAAKSASTKEDSDAEVSDEEIDMEEDRMLVERDVITAANLREGTFREVLQCVNDHVQNVEIPKSIENVTRSNNDKPANSGSVSEDAPKPSKRVVSGKFEKWKQDTISEALNKQREKSATLDESELLQNAADEILHKFGIH